MQSLAIASDTLAIPSSEMVNQALNSGHTLLNFGNLCTNDRNVKAVLESRYDLRWKSPQATGFNDSFYKYQ